MALVIVVLVGFLALVTDVGQFYLVRNRLQAAADSATLAAAQDIVNNKGTSITRATAQDYVDRNVTAPHQTTVTFNDEDVTVRVDVDQATFFGRIFGRSSVAIHASATAGASSVTTLSDVIPVAVPFSLIEGHVGESNPGTFDFGQEGSDSHERGLFWLVNLSNEGNVGESTYADWIEHGYPGDVGVGNILGGTGIRAGLKAALKNRMEARPHVIVPLYDFAETTGGNRDFHVVGYAEFVITGVDFQGNNKNISGYFTTGTLVDGGTTGPPPEVDYGVKVVRLKG